MHFERRVLLDVLLTSADGIDAAVVEAFARVVKRVCAATEDGRRVDVEALQVEERPPSYSKPGLAVAARDVEAGAMVVPASELQDLEQRLETQTKVAKAAQERCDKLEGQVERLSAVVEQQQTIVRAERGRANHLEEERRALVAVAGVIAAEGQSIMDAVVSLRIDRDVLREMVKRQADPPEPSRLLVERVRKFREAQEDRRSGEVAASVSIPAHRWHPIRLLAETAAVEVEQACVRFQVAVEDAAVNFGKEERHG